MRPPGQEQESLSDMIRKLRGDSDSGSDGDGDGSGKGTKTTAPRATSKPAVAGQEPKGRPSGPPPAPPRRKKKRSGRRR
jgi:YidC/Oxa1 family membrane protein insertase